MTINSLKQVLPDEPLDNKGVTAVDLFNALMARFGVSDVVDPDALHIFVLESPHLHEMMYERMLAGDSGEAFTERLATKKPKTNVPFGLYGTAPWPSKPKSLGDIGAMNACLFPMQADTYGPARKSLQGLERALKTLKLTRSNPTGTRRDPWDRAFEGLIAQHLAARIAALGPRQVFLHPCGDVARGLLKKAESFGPWPHVQVSTVHLRHPSFGAWGNLSRGKLLAMV